MGFCPVGIFLWAFGREILAVGFCLVGKSTQIVFPSKCPKIHINISRNLWKRIKHFKASKIKIFKNPCKTKWPNYRSNVSLTLHIMYCDIRKVIYKEWHYFCNKKISESKSNRKWNYFDIVYLQVVYTIFDNFFYLHLDLIYLEEIRIWWISIWKWQVSYWPRIQFISFVEAISNHVKE